MQGRVYAPGDSNDQMAAAIKDFNEFVIKDERVEVIALPFRDGVNIVQRRYDIDSEACVAISRHMQLGLIGSCCIKVKVAFA